MDRSLRPACQRCGAQLKFITSLPEPKSGRTYRHCALMLVGEAQRPLPVFLVSLSAISTSRRSPLELFLNSAV